MPYRRHSETTAIAAAATNSNEEKQKAKKRASLPNWDPRTPRIPKSLQNVFLAAARGEEVTEAPTNDKLFLKKLKLVGKKKGKKSKSKKKSKKIHKSVSMPMLHDDDEDLEEDKEEEPTEHQLQNPQRYLDKVLSSRGYSTQTYQSLRCAYHCRPNELQQASYGILIVKAVREGNVRLLKSLLDAGLSPSPCNMYGESLMHLVCRRSDHKVLNALLQYGCTLQVSDDFGRTPLHDACWQATPNFETIKLILGEDVRLLYITDARGATPLSYVAKDNRPKWIDFIDSIKETYWPVRDNRVEGYEKIPPLAQLPPHSNPVRDPPNALGISMALKVASGEIDVDDLLQSLLYDDDDNDDDDASVSSTDSELSYSNRTNRSVPVTAFSSSSFSIDEEDDVGYDDDNFLTPEEIAMTLAKYDCSRYLKEDDEELAAAVCNVKTSTKSLLTC